LCYFMFTTNSIANTISTIQNAYHSKKLYVEIPYCRANSQLLGQLKHLGYVESVLFLGSNARSNSGGGSAILHQSGKPSANTKARVRVYLKYIHHAPLYSGIRCYWHLHCKVTVSLDALGGLISGGGNNFGMVFLIFTDQGLLTGGQCVSRGLGGILVCGLYAIICVFRHAIR
jgi:ribosomal protein S8